MLTLLFWMLVGHALADYPLQGDFLAKAKNHRSPIPGVPWIHGLLWHALIHGGAVALVTGSLVLGCAEAVVHCAIDYAKCDGVFHWSYSRFKYRWEKTTLTLDGGVRIAFHVDQALHVLCKVAWALIAVYA